MAKKGAGFRLWFRKLSIKRFHNIATQRKRSRPSPHHLHGKDLLDGVLISSPYHTLHSIDNADSSSNCHSPPVVIFSSSCSPGNTFPVFSPSPWRHSFPGLMSPISPTSPCTSPTPPRRSGAGQRSSNKPQWQRTCTTAVLLSPINYKAMDIPYPSGGSSPAAFLQSPIFQAAPMASPARILSPPLSLGTHSRTILFRSPLHPLAQQTLAIPRNEGKSNAKQLLTTAQSLDGTSKEAKISLISSSKAKICAWTSRKSDAAACHSQAQYEEAACATESGKQSRARQTPIRASSTRQSPLIVDCGCGPNLSSSFRKTKKTLQACGSCSSSNLGVIPSYDRCYEQAMQKLRNIRDGVSVEESKKSVSAAGQQEETHNLFAEQGHGHSHEALSHKVLQQLRKRKKKMHGAMNESPIKVLNPQSSVHVIETPNMKQERISNDKKFKSCVFTDAHPGLVWDKEFSSFTSEDTFFSSFERSRPSFSSNSSSECFDKRHRRANLALSSVALVSNTSETPKHMHGNPVSNICNLHNAACDQNAKSKQGDPLIEVSFLNENKGVSEHGIVSSCRVASSEHRTRGTNAKPGVKRFCVSSLVGIKEASCEEGNTSTIEQANLSRKGCTSNIESLILNKQKKSSSSPDYVFSSHSDYYESPRARLWKNARTRKKSTKVGVLQGASDDTGSARLRRRAQLQAKWMLREERIQWQSSVDESEVDVVGGDNVDEGDAAQSVIKCVDEAPMPEEKRAGEIRLKLDAWKGLAAGISEEPKLEALKEADGAAAQTMPASNISESQCDGGQEEKLINQDVNVDTNNGFANKSRLMDSVAVVKSSRDPLVDFRDSMVDMIIERQIYTADDLGELLRCFLSLNPSEHHDIIVRAFMQVWARIFQGS